MVGIDKYTKLLLHCEGSDTSTTFTDSSAYKQTGTQVGAAQIDTAQYKFGSSSALFDGNTDYVTYPDSDNWNFGTGEWTIDFWVRFNAFTTTRAEAFISQGTDGNNSWMLTKNKNSSTPKNSLNLYVVSDGVSVVNSTMTNEWAANLGQWYHIAFVRSGANLYMFIDGVSQAITHGVTFNASTNFPDFTGVLCVGGWTPNIQWLNGWLDEVRISKGIARWTADFTPPTSAYTYANDSYTKLLIHANEKDASTVFADFSPSNNTITIVNQAQIDTAQYKFDVSSALFDGTADYLTAPDSDDFNFGTGDFTIDFWLRFNSVSGLHSFYQHNSSTTTRCEFYFDASGPGLYFYVNTASVMKAYYAWTWSPSTATWYHVALVRNGTDLSCYVNGAVLTPTVINAISTNDLGDKTGSPTIGYRTTWSDGSLNGWLDEYRISKGVARWTSDFSASLPTEYINDFDITVSASALSLASSVQTPSVAFDCNVFQSSYLDLVSSVLEGRYGNLVEISIDVLNLSSSVQNPASIVGTANISVGVLSLASSFPSSDVLQPVHGVTKIISYNPLVILTDLVILQLAVVDTTDPENPIYFIYTYPEASNAQDAYADTDYVYVSCADGLLLKIDKTDFTSYTIIDVSDTDNLTSVAYNATDTLLYASTDASTYESYIIDNRDYLTFLTNLTCVGNIKSTLNTYFSSIEGKILNTNFVVLTSKSNNSVFHTNFTVLSEDYNSITPIGREDWVIKIDDVQLDVRDVDLSSINITHTIDEKSRASFKLARQHDNLNYNYLNQNIVITNKNVVTIYIKDNLEFTGKVSQIDTTYAKGVEAVEVSAWSDSINTNYTLNTVTLSLPLLTEKRHLYHIIVQNPKIYNPYIDPLEVNPDKYLGIRISAGTKTKENIQKWSSFGDTEALAAQILKGDFTPNPNFTYFWLARVVKSTIDITSETGTATAETSLFPGYTFPTPPIYPGYSFPPPDWGFPNTGGSINYVGTSLGGTSAGKSTITNAAYKNQREYPETLYKLGDGTISETQIENSIPGYGTDLFSVLQSYGYINGSGVIQEKFKSTTNVFGVDRYGTINLTDKDFYISRGYNLSSKIYNLLNDTLGFYEGLPPYKNVSATSGQFEAQEKWVDKEDGLYVVKKDAYNYDEYAQKIAELEYQKICNINGDVLPQTSVNIDLTLDAYYFYKLKLLTRINIDGTTEVDIYNNNNGFPVAIKTISLNSSSMRVQLITDNKKSESELKLLDEQYPDEYDEKYFTCGYSAKMYQKYSIQTGQPIV